jgi:hypothetical protein
LVVLGDPPRQPRDLVLLVAVDHTKIRCLAVPTIDIPALSVWQDTRIARGHRETPRFSRRLASPILPAN